MSEWLPDFEFTPERTAWDDDREADRFAKLADSAIRNGGAPLDTDGEDDILYG